MLINFIILNLYFKKNLKQHMCMRAVEWIVRNIFVLCASNEICRRMRAVEWIVRNRLVNCNYLINIWFYKNIAQKKNAFRKILQIVKCKNDVKVCVFTK